MSLGKELTYSKFKLLLQVKGFSVNDIQGLGCLSSLNITNLEGNKVTLNILSEHGLIPVYTYYDSLDGVALLRINSTTFKDPETGITLSIENKPRSYDYLVNGKRFEKIASIYANHHLPLTTTNYCYYFDTGDECKFCAINDWSDVGSRNTGDKIQAIKIAQKEGEISHLSITTGTLRSPDRGLKGIVMLIKKIRAAGIELPIAIECEPTDQIELLNRSYQLGVTTISCNIEFLDDDVRRKLMPAKGTIGYDEYLGFLKKCVDIFGRNQVYSNILWSKFDEFNNIVQDRLLQLTSAGVIPSIGVLYSEKSSQLGNIRKPNIDEMINLQIFNAKQLQANDLNPLKALAGCPRNSSYSCINEFYREI